MNFNKLESHNCEQYKYNNNNNILEDYNKPIININNINSNENENNDVKKKVKKKKDVYFVIRN